MLLEVITVAMVVAVAMVAMAAEVAMVVVTVIKAKETKSRNIRVASNVEWGHHSWSRMWTFPGGPFNSYPMHGYVRNKWCCKWDVPIADSYRAWFSPTDILLASTPLSWWRLDKHHPFCAASLRQQGLSTWCVWSQGWTTPSKHTWCNSTISHQLSLWIYCQPAWWHI